MYAVPQPSSTTSIPATSTGRTRSELSGTCQTPHVISSCAQAAGAHSANSSAYPVQAARFSSAWSESGAGSAKVGEPERELACR